MRVYICYNILQYIIIFVFLYNHAHKYTENKVFLKIISSIYENTVKTLTSFNSSYFKYINPFLRNKSCSVK